MKYFCYAVVCFLCVSLSSFSQEKYSVRPKQKSQDNDSVFITSGKYSSTYGDYVIGKYNEITDLVVSARENSLIGGGDLKIEVKNKDLKKVLKKARIIEYQNMLLVNCKGLKNGAFRLGTGYAPAFCYSYKKIIFASMPVGSREAFITTSFGLVGASIVYDKLVCYSISSDSKNVNRIYEEDVEQMLFKRPDLLERYRNENRRDRTSARTVIKYLREAGLIKPSEEMQ